MLALLESAVASLDWFRAVDTLLVLRGCGSLGAGGSSGTGDSAVWS
jgi:hypothetical protein